MGLIQAVLNQINMGFHNEDITTSVIIAVLVMTGVLAFYEYVVYQFVLRRSLYNKAFNISIAILPFFIACIIMCLQSSMVITLGTIGALAIIRFRTAVKDPVDLIFILWAIFIGITCGCKLYMMAFLTSIVVTLILVLLNNFKLCPRSHILVIHSNNSDVESNINTCLDQYCKKYRTKSRNYTDNGMDFIFEIVTKHATELVKELEQNKNIKRFSLMEYDSDDIL